MSTRPDWVDESEVLDIEDPAILADIERAMNDRGYKTSDAGDGDEGQLSTLSVQATETTSQLPADANDSIGADAPPSALDVGGTSSPPDVEDSPTVTTESNTFAVQLPSGDQFNMNQEQANYLIQLHNWVDSQPDSVKDAWRRIEEGTGQVIPNEDFTAYQSWVAVGRPTGTQPAPNVLPERPYMFDANMVDASTADYITKLEDLARANIAPVTATQSTNSPSYTAADVEYYSREQANRQMETNDALESAKQNVAQKYNLSVDQIEHMISVTPGMNIVPGIAERHRQYSPTGVLISDAPMKTVFNEAFETAMVLDPTLAKVRDEHKIQQYLANNQQTLSAVAQKKANAGSLATTPSAAVPGRDIDPRSMTAQQRHAAMVAELGEAMSGN